VRERLAGRSLPPVLQRESGDLQRRGPALGACGQAGDLGRGELHAHRLRQEGCHLRLGELQVGLANLGQLAPHAQFCERERRVFAGQDDQVRVPRQVSHQKRQRVMDRGGGDDMVVVQDKRQAVRQVAGRGAQVVDQRGEDGLRRQRLACAEERGRALPQPKSRRPQRGDQPSQEARRVVVTVIERQPRGRGVAARGRAPLGQQGRLAGAGRRGDQRQRAGQARHQPLDQARPRDEVGPRKREQELGGEDRGGHRLHTFEAIVTQVKCKPKKLIPTRACSWRARYSPPARRSPPATAG